VYRETEKQRRWLREFHLHEELLAKDDGLRATLKQLEAMVLERKSKPCKDCGGQFKPHQMQFDHLDGDEKVFNISQWRTLLPSPTVLTAEMDKCDVVCANCHADRTFQRNAAARKIAGEKKARLEEAKRKFYATLPVPMRPPRRR
jgi:hypothetical protein